MKKLTYIIITLMLVLAPLKALAASRVTLSEKDNGVIDTKLHFDDGFVGGLDLNINLSENVKVTKFDFNKDFAKNNYTTEYTYKDGTLNIKITTGGKNLLNSKKELNLGAIYVSATSDKSVSYAINISDMKVIDINLKSYEVENNAISVNGQNIFTYEVTEKDDSKEDKDDNNTTDDKNNNNNPSDKNENTKPSESTNNPQDSNVNNNNTTTPNNNGGENNTVNNSNNEVNKDKDKNENKEENKTEEKEDNKQEVNKENTSKPNETHKNNIPNFLKVVLALIILVAIVIIIVLIIRFRKIRNLDKKN